MKIDSETKPTDADVAALILAAQQAMDWIDRFGQDAPLKAIGAAEVSTSLRQALIPFVQAAKSIPVE